MKKIFFASFSILFLLITACSTYNQVLKSDDYDEKFRYANELYDSGKYAQSINLFEQVYQRFPKAAQGEIAYFRMGKAFYMIEDYYMAGYYLGTYATRFPFSEKAEEALFLSAMCSVNNSPNYALDQNDTEVAINELQQFVDRYPNSVLVDSCNNIMDKLHYKLERKDYNAVKLYSKTMNYRAAVMSAETFVGQYPGSVFAEEVFYLYVKNSADLAENSISSKKRERIEQTLERYRNFVAEYPVSSYLKELSTISSRMDVELQELIIAENKKDEL